MRTTNATIGRPEARASLAGLLLLAGAVWLAGCTTVEVKRVDPESDPIKTVCIKRNPKVGDKDLLPIVMEGFRRHGIEAEVFEADPAGHCEYVLTYLARQGSDLIFFDFLTHAELRLRRGDDTVGSAIYDHSGGFALCKFAGTATKMNPVIDDLLVGFPGTRPARSP